MTRFIKASTLSAAEIEAGIADGSLQYAALGATGGEWLVETASMDDSEEILQGPPGGDLAFAHEYKRAEDASNE